MVGILPELSNQITAGEEILLAGNQLKVNSRAHIGSRMDAGLFIVIPIFIIYLTTISRRITINYLPQLIALILLSVALFFLVHYLLHASSLRGNKKMQYIFTNNRIMLFHEHPYFLPAIMLPFWYHFAPKAIEKYHFGCGSFYYKDILRYEINNKEKSCALEYFFDHVLFSHGLFSSPIKLIFFPQTEHLRKIEEILSHYVGRQ